MKNLHFLPMRGKQRAGPRYSMRGNGDLLAQFLFSAGMSALFKICFSPGALQCLTNDSVSQTHTRVHVQKHIRWSAGNDEKQ